MVSIIIPVYNVEKYLERCLDSLMRQTYTNFEIVLIDDGSSDNSGVICDKYAGQYDNISVYHTPNGGASAARNLGLTKAKGDYIMFVDSDDEIHPSCVETLLNLIETNNADISCCDCEKFTTKYSGKVAPSDVQVLGRHDVLKRLAVNYLWACVWGKLYKRDIWNEMAFPEDRMNEDEAVMHKVYYSAERIVFTEQKLYGYYTNPQGMMSAQFTPKGLDRFKSYHERLSFYEEHHEEELYRLTIIEILDQMRAYGNNLDSSEYGEEKDRLRSEAGELISKYRSECKISIWNYPHIYAFAYPKTRPVTLMVRALKKLVGQKKTETPKQPD